MNIHGRGVDPHGSLSGVLRAATAPAHPSELAGEEAAVTAFLAAEPAPRRSLLARILTVKAVIVAAAAVSTGVVVAATGDLPWTHTPNQPPADPPSVTDPASVPAMTQPAGPPPSSSTSDPPGPETPPSTAAVPNGPGNERDQPDGKQDKPDRDGKGGKEDDRNKDGSGHPMPSTGPTEPQQRDNSQTPGSTARGAVTAVPPNGAKPPSQGG